MNHLNKNGAESHIKKKVLTNNLQWHLSVHTSTCPPTGGVVQSGGEVRRHREGAGATEDAAGGLPARHLQPHDPELPCVQCLHTGGQRAGKSSTRAQTLAAPPHMHTIRLQGSAALMKGCNKFEEAISGLIGGNVITQAT